MLSEFTVKNREVVNILRKNNVVFAAIFGSRAKGNFRPGSDYDLLIEYMPKKNTPSLIS